MYLRSTGKTSDLLEEASRAYQRVIELDYSDYDVCARLLRLLHHNNDLSDAIGTLFLRDKKFPDVAELYYQAAIITMLDNQRKESFTSSKKSAFNGLRKAQRNIWIRSAIEKWHRNFNLISAYRK